MQTVYRCGTETYGLPDTRIDMRSTLKSVLFAFKNEHCPTLCGNEPVTGAVKGRPPSRRDQTKRHERLDLYGIELLCPAHQSCVKSPGHELTYRKIKRKLRGYLVLTERRIGPLYAEMNGDLTCCGIGNCLGEKHGIGVLRPILQKPPIKTVSASGTRKRGAEYGSGTERVHFAQI